jgi:hypothetical protein
MKPKVQNIYIHLTVALVLDIGLSKKLLKYFISDLMEVNVNIAVFWDMMPCSLVDRYQRFTGNCFLYFYGRESNVMYSKPSL